MADEIQIDFTDLSPEDATFMKGLMERNANFKQAYTNKTALFEAFRDGNTQKIDSFKPVETKPAAVAATVTETKPAAAAASAAFDIAELDRMLDQKFTAKFADSLKSQSDILKSTAKEVFTEMGKTFGEEVLTRAAQTSDEIYQVRRSHEKEFNEELDTNKFTEFINSHKGQYKTLSEAHDAMVSEARFPKRVDNEVATKLKAKESTDVPGTMLRTANTPLGAMMRHNETVSKVSGEARGVGLDNAVKAFRELQSKHSSEMN
jgi:hypothetical protein